MILEALVLGLLIGTWRGGRMANLAEVRWRWPLLFVFAMLWQRIPFLMVREWPALQPAVVWLYLSSYALLAVAVGLNWDDPAFRWIGLGLLLNFLVIALNGGRMPVWSTAVDIARLKVDLTTAGAATSPHTLMTEATRLKFLGDVLPLPPPYPRPRVLSIGDVFLAVGIAFLLIRGMGTRRERRSEARPGTAVTA